MFFSSLNQNFNKNQQVNFLKIINKKEVTSIKN
jgi:hypothetical protein